MTSAFSWQNSISFCPASFCTPRLNLSVTPRISWLLTFAFQSPIMKKISFLHVSSRRSCRSSRTVQLQFLQHYWLGHRLGLLWYWTVCLGNEQRSFCRFRDCIQVLHFRLFCWLWWLPCPHSPLNTATDGLVSYHQTSVIKVSTCLALTVLKPVCSAAGHLWCGDGYHRYSFIHLFNKQSSVQFSLVTQSRPMLCDHMDCSTPGLPVHHQLPRLAQTHVHWASSVQFSCSVVSQSLQLHGLQHIRPPCPSPTPRAYSNSYPSVMPSNHLILCRPLLLLPSIFPSIKVFSNESALRMKWPKYCSFSFSIRLSNE